MNTVLVERWLSYDSSPRMIKAWTHVVIMNAQVHRVLGVYILNPLLRVAATGGAKP